MSSELFKSVDSNLKLWLEDDIDSIPYLCSANLNINQIDEINEPTAREKVVEMCDKLLANPVIEEYRFELEKVN